MVDQLGRYEVVGTLGQGAMGVVYKARDPLIDRIVAIKTINLGLALEEKEEYEERFYQEAKAAGRLSHPNIVTIYDVGKSGDVAYIAMEFLRGQELRDIMNESGLLPIDRVLDIAAQVAQGLAYAHEHGIVHRDVKPSNIMVGKDGHVKITDFGIARMASSAVRTQTGMVLGSPKYMSPEQVMGKELDQRSDIFSLGVMLYEMLTGQAAFDGENVNAIMYKTLNLVLAPPNTLNPEVPEMANYILAKALTKGMEDRYQDAHDFAADLRACRNGLPRPDRLVKTSKQLAHGKKKSSDGDIAVEQTSPGDDKGKPVSIKGLSPAFDSAAATMRLAALTASSADVDHLSKALKMAPPPKKSAQARAVADKTVEQLLRPQPVEPAARSRRGGILLAVIILVAMLAVAAMFAF